MAKGLLQKWMNLELIADVVIWMVAGGTIASDTNRIREIYAIGTPASGS
jgi:hypothetical protein